MTVRGNWELSNGVQENKDPGFFGGEKEVRNKEVSTLILKRFEAENL